MGNPLLFVRRVCSARSFPGVDTTRWYLTRVDKEIMKIINNKRLGLLHSVCPFFARSQHAEFLRGYVLCQDLDGYSGEPSARDRIPEKTEKRRCLG